MASSSVRHPHLRNDAASGRSVANGIVEMTAKDLMTRNVAALSPLTTVGEAARLLTEQRISGAPVVDGKGNLLGVVSQTDLVRHQSGRPEGWPGEPAADPALTPVVSLMTGAVVTCDEETPL